MNKAELRQLLSTIYPAKADFFETSSRFKGTFYRPPRPKMIIKHRALRAGPVKWIMKDGVML